MLASPRTLGDNVHLGLCGTDRPLSEDTDKALVRRVQAGDARAFDLLFMRYQHKINNLVARFVRSNEDIEDITQEAFIKAYRALPRFRGESAFYTWLYRIAVNTAKNHLASASRRLQQVEIEADGAETGEVAQALTDPDDPEGSLRSDQLRQAISHAIEALPPDLRSALTLREFDGLSYAEIADVMDCPVGTVRSRIFRAREAVDAVIRPLLDHDGGRTPNRAGG